MNMSEATSKRLRSARLEVKSILLISLGIAGLVLVFVLIWSRIGVVHTQASRDASAKVNVLGCQVLAFVDSTVARSEASKNAQAHSPTVSQLQKTTAERNLIGLKIVQADAHSKIHPTHCPKKKTVRVIVGKGTVRPPETTTPRSTVSRVTPSP